MEDKKNIILDENINNEKKDENVNEKKEEKININIEMFLKKKKEREN